VDLVVQQYQQLLEMVLVDQVDLVVAEVMDQDLLEEVQMEEQEIHLLLVHLKDKMVVMVVIRLVDLVVVQVVQEYLLVVLLLETLEMV
tara:strand:- start:229 stop:492 length:264 start_codon:yes stop_codon:yes gene_type:complete